MSFHGIALSLAVDTALAAWLGVMAFFSFVGAPRAFAVYGDRGGEYVNDVFPRYYRIGVGLGTAAFAAGLGLGTVQGYGISVWVLLAAAAVGTGLAAYSLWALLPKMAAAGADGFRRYHRRSVVLNGAMMAAVAVALVAAHLIA